MPFAGPATGTLTYNGHEFSVLTRTHISGRPMLDRARRTVKYIEYNLEVDGYVQAGGTANDATDTTMASLRRSLTAPAGALVYKNKGFGDLVVNSPADGPARDVEWGPIPELVDYSPVGNNLGAKVIWRCTTRIPDGQHNKYREGPLEFCYTVDYEIDGDGYSRVSTNGQLVIPMTRVTQGSRAIPDTADKWREKIRYAEPVGFKREVQRWHLSEDKRTINFSIADQELPFALPPGCTRCDIRHSIGSELNDNSVFVNWSGRIGGTITMARGIPKVESFRKFLALLNRLLGDQKAEPGKIVPVARRKGGTLFLQSLNIDNEVFGRSTSYDVRYEIMGVTINTFLEASGMFKYPGENPVEDYKKMTESLKDSSGHVRGFAKLRHQPSLDKIIDLNMHVDDVDIVIGVHGNPPPTNDPAKQAEAGLGVNPESSWLEFKNRLILHSMSGKGAHLPLGDDFQSEKGPDAGKLSEQNNPNARGGIMGLYGRTIDAAAKTIPKDGKSGMYRTKLEAIAQQISPPSYRVLMVGRAKRIGYGISVPEVKTIAGVKPTEGDRLVAPCEVGRIADIPVYGLAWQIEYFLTKPPTAKDLDIPANPRAQIQT